MLNELKVLNRIIEIESSIKRQKKNLKVKTVLEKMLNEKKRILIRDTYIIHFSLRSETNKE